MITPDKCRRLLHMLGFSVGEAAFDLPSGRREWQVDASRDGHTVLAKATTQSQAWEHVTRMVGRLIRSGVLVISILLVGGCGPPASQQSTDLVTQGMLRHRAGDPAGAIKCFDLALEINPQSADAHVWRAVAHESMGNEALKKADLNEAKTLLDETIKKNPQESRWYVTRAQVHSIEGDTEAALTDCSRAVELAPTDPDVFEGRAAIHVLRGDLAKAVDDLTEAIQLAPFSTDLYQTRESIWQRMGETEKAEVDFARAKETGVQLSNEPLDLNE